MLTNVVFRHPAEFVPLSEDDGILAVTGAGWFFTLLGRVSDLQIDEDLYQEDWGVVLFARRGGKRYWIGLNMWDGEGRWLAHFHHGSFAWLQRFSSSGKRDLQRLVSDVHYVLATEPEISDVLWYDDIQLNQPKPTGSPKPVEG